MTTIQAIMSLFFSFVLTIPENKQAGSYAAKSQRWQKKHRV